jgi:hypothetical protein
MCSFEDEKKETDRPIWQSYTNENIKKSSTVQQRYMLFLPLPSFGFSLSSPFRMRKGVFDLSITHNSWNSWRAEGGKFFNFSLLLLL